MCGVPVMVALSHLEVRRCLDCVCMSMCVGNSLMVTMRSAIGFPFAKGLTLMCGKTVIVTLIHLEVRPGFKCRSLSVCVVL